MVKLKCIFGYLCVNETLFKAMFTNFSQEEQEYETVMAISIFYPYRV